MGYMSSFVHLMRPETDQKMLANVVGFLVQGFTLSLLYMYYFKGESPVKEGIAFGLLTGLIVALPYVFFMWANYTVRYKGVILDGLGMGFRIFVTGIVIALIFGKKKDS